MTTGLVEGCGVFMLFSPWARADAGARNMLLVLLLVFTAGRLAAWLAYLRGLNGNAPTAALAVLTRSSPLFIIAGHLLPAILIVAAQWLPPG